MVMQGTQNYLKQRKKQLAIHIRMSPATCHLLAWGMQKRTWIIAGSIFGKGRASHLVVVVATSIAVGVLCPVGCIFGWIGHETVGQAASL